MSLKTVLYVSRSKIPTKDAEAQLTDLVRLARVRNAKLDVTGALIYTGPRFAQHLEGSASAVEELMASIERDRRHETIVRLPAPTTGSRRFQQWAMAYSGPSSYVDRHLRVLFQDLSDHQLAESCEALVELMWALNTTNEGQS